MYLSSSRRPQCPAGPSARTGKPLRDWVSLPGKGIKLCILSSQRPHNFRHNQSEGSPPRWARPFVVAIRRQTPSQPPPTGGGAFALPGPCHPEPSWKSNQSPYPFTSKIHIISATTKAKDLYHDEQDPLLLQPAYRPPPSLLTGVGIRFIRQTNLFIPITMTGSIQNRMGINPHAHWQKLFGLSCRAVYRPFVVEQDGLPSCGLTVND